MWSGICQSPTTPFTPIKGMNGAGMGSCDPSMPVTVVQPGFVNGEAKRGSEATELWEGVPPSHGREIFENSCMQPTFSCTLNVIIRGSLCSGIDRFPTLFSFLFFLFLLNLSQGNIFFLFFLFVFFRFFYFYFSLFPLSFLFYSQINRGGGHGPLCPPLSYASDTLHQLLWARNMSMNDRTNLISKREEQTK